MGLGTKNRQNQTAETCRAHLRAAHRAQSELVEEFILEIEGGPVSPDITRWGKFTDTSRNVDAMLQRLDERFARWLNGES
ncbi:MAG: hypothetical protein ACFUZC_06125 [Chthoniobacteraceae bacterium]